MEEPTWMAEAMSDPPENETDFQRGQRLARQDKAAADKIRANESSKQRARRIAKRSDASKLGWKNRQDRKTNKGNQQ